MALPSDLKLHPHPISPPLSLWELEATVPTELYVYAPSDVEKRSVSSHPPRLPPLTFGMIGSPLTPPPSNTPSKLLWPIEEAYPTPDSTPVPATRRRKSTGGALAPALEGNPVHSREPQSPAYSDSPTPSASIKKATSDSSTLCPRSFHKWQSCQKQPNSASLPPPNRKQHPILLPRHAHLRSSNHLPHFTRLSSSNPQPQPTHLYSSNLPSPPEECQDPLFDLATGTFLSEQEVAQEQPNPEEAVGQIDQFGVCNSKAFSERSSGEDSLEDIKKYNEREATKEKPKRKRSIPITACWSWLRNKEDNREVVYNIHTKEFRLEKRSVILKQVAHRIDEKLESQPIEMATPPLLRDGRVLILPLPMIGMSMHIHWTIWNRNEATTVVCVRKISLPMGVLLARHMGNIREIYVEKV